MTRQRRSRDSSTPRGFPRYSWNGTMPGWIGSFGRAGQEMGAKIRMFEKLEALKARYEELSQQLADPAVIADQEAWRRGMREHAELEEVVRKYEEYEAVRREIEELEALLREETDEELCTMAAEELSTARSAQGELVEALKLLLIPKDPNDEKNVILEIRAGTGGEEAALFSAVLFRMYSMYAERHGWQTELLNVNETELGGYKEISFMISGDGAYSRLKYESGVHRVQRVPETETQGRVHTSTATVAVLPEVDDVEIEINPKDLQIDTFRSSGAGGQHINKTSSAIRITHLPTGMVVECQDERSQFKNKDKAMRVLRSRLYEIEQAKQDAKVAADRRSQVGTGDRSERIRTYNYPQGRLTDHRIGLTLYRLDDILNGDLDEVIDALVAADRAAKLEQSVESQG